MKYLCLVAFDERQLEAMSQSESDALAAECLAYGQALQKSGRLLAAQTLQSVQSATTVRVRRGKLCVTDGPFAETNEQLGGFILIEAADLNDAIQVAAKIPLARLGCIEVRPIEEIARALLL
jgi:hypothetical protein